VAGACLLRFRDSAVGTIASRSFGDGFALWARTVLD
jgi:hypothetical protein